MTSAQHAPRRVRFGPRFAVRGADVGRRLDTFLAIAIFVVQIFVFAEEQLAGTIGLIVALLAWGALRSAMSAERERAAIAVET
jgi:hypothetical protein